MILTLNSTLIQSAFELTVQSCHLVAVNWNVLPFHLDNCDHFSLAQCKKGNYCGSIGWRQHDWLLMLLALCQLLPTKHDANPIATIVSRSLFLMFVSTTLELARLFVIVSRLLKSLIEARPLSLTHDQCLPLRLSNLFLLAVSGKAATYCIHEQHECQLELPVALIVVICIQNNANEMHVLRYTMRITSKGVQFKWRKRANLNPFVNVWNLNSFTDDHRYDSGETERGGGRESMGTRVWLWRANNVAWPKPSRPACQEHLA